MTGWVFYAEIIAVWITATTLKVIHLNVVQHQTHTHKFMNNQLQIFPVKTHQDQIPTE